MKTKMKKLMSLFGWVTCVMLGLVIAGLLFIKLSGEYKIYLVRSGSMAPAIETGDVVVIGPVNGPVNSGLWPGKIVTYVSGQITPGKSLVMTTHRLLSIDGEVLTVKGDANEAADKPILRGQVTGVYLFKIPYVGYINAFVHTRKGWLVTVILPAMALIGLLAKDIIKEAFKPEPAKVTASPRGEQS